MSAFVVNVTPTRLKNAKNQPEMREPTLLIMAPFTPKAVVTFDDVPISKTAKRLITVKNPHPSEIKVLVTKIPKSEYIVGLEWTSSIIPSNGESHLELTWSPIQVVSARDIIQFTDSLGNKKDVQVILKSKVLKEPTKKAVKKQASERPSYVLPKKLKLKTPSPPKEITRKSVIHKTVTKTKSQTPPRVVSNRGVLIQSNASNIFSNDAFNFSKIGTPAKFKENASPSTTPTNASQLFNNLRFTPSTEPRVKVNFDLVDAPTPKAIGNLNNYKLFKTPDDTVDPDQKEELDFSEKIKRRLNATSSPIDSPLKVLTPKSSLRNKTKIIYHTDELPPITPPRIVEIDPQGNEFGPSYCSTVSKWNHANSLESLDEIQVILSSSENTTEMCIERQPLNKTHNVSESGNTSPLSMIVEENSIEMGKTYLHHQNIEKGLQQTFKISGDGAKSISEDNLVSQLDISTMSTKSEVAYGLFKDTEIRAQSSCINLHEIGREHDLSALRRSYSESDGIMTFSPPKYGNRNQKSSSSVNFQQKNSSTKRLTLVKKAFLPPPEPERVILFDSERHLRTTYNPDAFAATTTADPFLISTMYMDERTIDRNEKQIMKWLNALVTIPADLDADSSQKIDVCKLFNEVKNKELTLAPTKELVSSKYYTNRLDTLRSAGISLYTSEELAMPLKKVTVQIDKDMLSLRKDQSLHLDLVMQKNILELLLCFNPMWLRLGLEITYGEEIQMNSVRDVVSLSSFIVNRLFKDKYLESKHGRLSPDYGKHMKRFTFKRFLCMLFFLDVAKKRKLIKHNPCMFMKNAPYKETKQILLRFSSYLVSSIGDIVKFLGRFGYELSHKQTYLDEFNFAFQNLAVDLRDGVRLTKIMEIILLRDDLSQLLRVPTVSSLQKVHNVNLAMKALGEAGFSIKGDITAKDIVYGHREKTLSLLWQILYNFRAPKFNAAATTIQSWWRKKLLKVTIHRRIQEKKLLRQISAATKIQAAFRGYLVRKKVAEYKKHVVESCIVLQKNVKSFLVRQNFLKTKMATIKIQIWWRSVVLMRKQKENYNLQKISATKIQIWFRRQQLAGKLLTAAPVIKKLKNDAKKRHEMAIVIQKTLKSFVIRKKFRQIVFKAVEIIRNHNLEVSSAIKIQSYFRMQKVRQGFLATKNVAIILQRRWRARTAMKKEMANYEQMKKCASKIQTYFRGYQAMKIERAQLLNYKANVILMQQKFRALIQMRKERDSFVKTKNATIVVQRRFRAILQMRKDKRQFLMQKSAAICIQLRFRALMLMRKTRAEYLQLKNVAICIQNKRRATMLMRDEREKYQSIVKKVILIQRAFRATQQMKIVRLEFLTMQYSATVIQRQFKAIQMMKMQRTEYLTLKSAAIVIQRRYRAVLAMRKQRQEFLLLKKSIICIQQKFRAYQMMKIAQSKFENDKKVIINLQKRWRATCEMQIERNNYQNTRNKVILIQRKLKATLLMQKIRNNYLLQRNSTVKIQNYFRGYVQMKKDHAEFERKRKAAIKIQKKLRATLAMRKERRQFLALKQSAIKIQRIRRALVQMRVNHRDFQRKRRASSVIQEHFRNYLLMKRNQRDFKQMRVAAITVQTIFRAQIMMRVTREMFLGKRQASIKIQQRWRATVQMRKDRKQYQLGLNAIRCLQIRFRAHLQMKKERAQYLHFRKIVIFVQTSYREKLQCRNDRTNYLKLKDIVLKLQCHIRGYLARSKLTPEYRKMKSKEQAARKILAVWRGYKSRKNRSTQLSDIAKRLMQYRKNKDPTKTVGYLIMSSMKFLKGKYNAHEVLNILQRLQNISRTVPHLFIDHADFVARFCYGMMAQSIRSEVDKLIIELCACVILNLSRFQPTKEASFQQDGLVTVAQMLLRWCDKDCGIFNTLCTLIYVFSFCENKKNKIRNFMISREAIYYLNETKKLVARKESMKKNVKKPFGCFLPPNPLLMKQHPSRDPDFGIIKNKPYIFYSSVFAFDVVLQRLNVNIS